MNEQVPYRCTPYTSAPYGSFQQLVLPNVVDWWRVDSGVTKTWDDPDWPVSNWKGCINGINLAQSTGNKQPYWVDNSINGYPAIVFDGVDDYLAVTYEVTYSQPISVIIVCSEPTDATFRHMIDGDSGDRRLALFWRQESSKYALYFGSVFKASSQGLDSGFKIWSLVANGASTILRVNGSEVLSGQDSGTDDVSGLTIGSRYGGANYSDISITDIIVVNAALTTGQLQLAETWLNNSRGGIY